jgi:hypothetical protein
VIVGAVVVVVVVVDESDSVVGEVGPLPHETARAARREIRKVWQCFDIL